MKSVDDIPITPINTESSIRVRTGDWKTFYPKMDREKCIKCYICWKFCPDVAIKVVIDEYPTWDLDHCKGCGICAHECPKQAIEMIMEE
jgi:2-oxoisovalerate ferredoxin oxidoreductase delta subunit